MAQGLSAEGLTLTDVIEGLAGRSRNWVLNPDLIGFRTWQLSLHLVLPEAAVCACVAGCGASSRGL